MSKLFTCDTCGKTSPIVSRVIIDLGYDRSLSKPLYNCPECFEKKEKARLGEKTKEGKKDDIRGS